MVPYYVRRLNQTYILQPSKTILLIAFFEEKKYNCGFDRDTVCSTVERKMIPKSFQDRTNSDINFLSLIVSQTV